MSLFALIDGCRKTDAKSQKVQEIWRRVNSFAERDGFDETTPNDIITQLCQLSHMSLIVKVGKQVGYQMAFSTKLKESEEENIYQLGLKEIPSISSTCSEKENANQKLCVASVALDSKKKLEDEKNAKLKSERWEEKKALLLPELQDIGMCIVRNFREKKKGCSMTKTDLIDSVSRGHIGFFFKRSHKEIAYFLELFTEALPEYFDIKTYDEEIYFTRKDKDCKIDMVRYKLKSFLDEKLQRQKNLTVDEVIQNMAELKF